MKASPAQIAALIDKPPAGVRFYLFYGPDEAAADELAARVLRAAGPGAERVDVDPAMLKANPGRLLEEASSPSLFGDRRVVRIAGIEDAAREAVALLLDAAADTDLVVATAPALTNRSELHKLAERHARAVAHILYRLDGAKAEALAAQIARTQGLRLVGDVGRRLADAAAGDRAVLSREIEKLSLYLDASPDRPAEVTMATLTAIGADLGEATLSEAIDAVLSGRTQEIGEALALLDAAGTARVPLLRQMGKRLVALAPMRAEVERGADPADVVERRRVFWKERPATVRMLQRWTSAEIAHVLARVRETERALMASGTAGEVLADAMALALARSASRGR